MSNPNPVQLTSLFSTPYLLIYAIPLLICSLLLTFAGSFLTLDRTRTFVPRSDAVPGSFRTDQKRKKRFVFILEGGIGGLAMGYVSGVLGSTFLALAIMNKTSQAPLGKTPFLVVWLLSATFTTLLAGRFKYAALAFIGLIGGISLTLSLSIIMHPSLQSRVILLAVLTPLSLLLTLLPIPLTQRTAIRSLITVSGAFATVQSIALLAHMPSWSNSWERFWTPNSVEWGTPSERSLDAAFSLFWAFGAASDCALQRWLGENPDEKWDSYLANFTANLPNSHKRAGNWTPLKTWWERATEGVFGKRGSPPIPIVFPPDEMLKPKGSTSYLNLSKEDPDVENLYSGNYTTLPPPRPFLRKARTLDIPPETPTRPRTVGKKRGNRTLTMDAHREKRGVRFRPEDEFVSSSEESGEEDALTTPKHSHSSRSNPRTRIAGDGDRNDSGSEVDVSQIGKTFLNEQPDYSDVEDGYGFGGRRTATPMITAMPMPVPIAVPEFLARSNSRRSSQGKSASSNSGSSTRSSKPTSLASSATLNAGIPGSVPVTPSLINALKRVAVAQEEAYGAGMAMPKEGQPLDSSHSEPQSKDKDDAPKPVGSRPLSVPLQTAPFKTPQSDKEAWEGFWARVQAGAAGGISNVR